MSWQDTLGIPRRRRLWRGIGSARWSWRSRWPSRSEHAPSPSPLMRQRPRGPAVRSLPLHHARPTPTDRLSIPSTALLRALAARQTSSSATKQRSPAPVCWPSSVPRSSTVGVTPAVHAAWDPALRRADLCAVDGGPREERHLGADQRGALGRLSGGELRAHVLGRVCQQATASRVQVETVFLLVSRGGRQGAGLCDGR
jgi:hypothetical protein